MHTVVDGDSIITLTSTCQVAVDDGSAWLGPSGVHVRLDPAGSARGLVARGIRDTDPTNRW